MLSPAVAPVVEVVEVVLVVLVVLVVDVVEVVADEPPVMMTPPVAPAPDVANPVAPLESRMHISNSTTTANDFKVE